MSAIGVTADKYDAPRSDRRELRLCLCLRGLPQRRGLIGRAAMAYGVPEKDRAQYE
jgi:hypothetical protein